MIGVRFYSSISGNPYDVMLLLFIHKKGTSLPHSTLIRPHQLHYLYLLVGHLNTGIHLYYLIMFIGVYT